MMANGDVVIGGAFNGTMNAGGTTMTSTSNSLDIFLARFVGASGAHLWSVSKGGSGQDVIYDVAASGASIVTTGYFSGSTTYGGNTLTAAGDDDVFVAQFDASNGAHQFSVRMGGINIDQGAHLSIRSDGQIAVTGVFAATADFGGTMITSNGGFDPFLVEMDSGGSITAAKSAGGPSRDEAHDVVSTDDSLIFGGSFNSSINVFNQTFTSLGGLDGYLVRYKR